MPDDAITPLEPEDVAGAVLFFDKRTCRFYHRPAIVVDGGQYRTG